MLKSRGNASFLCFTTVPYRSKNLLQLRDRQARSTRERRSWMLSKTRSSRRSMAGSFRVSTRKIRRLAEESRWKSRWRCRLTNDIVASSRRKAMAENRTVAGLWAQAITRRYDRRQGIVRGEVVAIGLRKTRHHSIWYCDVRVTSSLGASSSLLHRHGGSGP